MQTLAFETPRVEFIVIKIESMFVMLILMSWWFFFLHFGDDVAKNPFATGKKLIFCMTKIYTMFLWCSFPLFFFFFYFHWTLAVLHLAVSVFLVRVSNWLPNIPLTPKKNMLNSFQIESWTWYATRHCVVKQLGHQFLFSFCFLSSKPHNNILKRMCLYVFIDTESNSTQHEIFFLFQPISNWWRQYCVR